jgi:hypothetical protein
MLMKIKRIFITAAIMLILTSVVACKSKTNDSRIDSTDEPVPETPETVEQQPIDDLRYEIEDNFGIKLIYSDNTYPVRPYDYNIIEDEPTLRSGLQMLNEELALYPEGFFKKLRRGNDIPMTIILSGAITGVLSGAAQGGVMTLSDDGSVVILLQIDGNSWITGETNVFLYLTQPFITYALHHEIGHAIDYFLASPFDPNAWYKTMPRGFFYDILERAKLDGEDWENFVSNHDYVFNPNSLDNDSLKDVYLCDIYSKWDLPEHIASNFGYSMLNLLPVALESPHIQEQLAYYFDLIRTRFEDDSWPETTHWERALLSKNKDISAK